MPVLVVLVDEDGTPERGLPDPHGGTFDAAGDFDRLIPFDDPASPMWRHIDPYGDTVFNRLQMPDFINELDGLRSAAEEGPESRGLDRLRIIAERCRTEVHLFVRFIGD